ncbi:unnamed protein product [Rotaria sp. Silwood1]|nr:unnamed protein product [Rotaria sp. Silwood1]CAF4679440.1 unnamed protein product [Rotaria sp. Silwood1]
MDAQFERRLLLSMNGRNSLSSYISPIQSPIKTSDRYIPLRSSLSASDLHYSLNTSLLSSPIKKCKYELNEIGLSSGITASEPDLLVYEQLLQNTLLNTNIDSILKISDVQNTNNDNLKTVVTPNKTLISKENSSIFRYSERQDNIPCKSNLITKQHFNRSPISNASIHLLYSPKRKIRHIPELPYKVLDAPDLQDDFYLNLIDWSSSNILSVALGSCVYLHYAQTIKLYFNLGTQRGHIHIYDVTTRKRIQSICKHTNRVGVLAWNDWSLCSGSRDRSILEHDIRQQSIIHHFYGHTQEVCGLKWSPDKSILASGGNDNRLFLWSKSQSSQPLHSFKDHIAAVKAIAWSPHQHGLLASGGGAADRHIRFRSSLTCQTSSIYDTGSQVCQLLWSKNSLNELASTHGVTQNHIIIWKYPTMEPLAKLEGHRQRVLYLAMSPDGESIVTGSGDETLRFWNVFAKAKSTRNPDSKFNGLYQMR